MFVSFNIHSNMIQLFMISVPIYWTVLQMLSNIQNSILSAQYAFWTSFKDTKIFFGSPTSISPQYSSYCYSTRSKNIDSLEILRLLKLISYFGIRPSCLYQLLSLVKFPGYSIGLSYHPLWKSQCCVIGQSIIMIVIWSSEISYFREIKRPSKGQIWHFFA